ncbi:MAG: EscU/YscU/HrcU family type III secretion system export apparatus switch protein, partial [Burkholderiaceae bacterium]|nr:EscU/YscU/HrcU family type III secretion system export apparatus switch protein [Burkholderiaceae bacterium]
MSSEKTEQPTLHKLRQARKDGQVAHSKDFTQTLLIVALFGYTLANSETIVRQFSEMILLPATLYGADFWLAVDIMGNRLLRLGVEMLTPYLLLVIGLGLAAEFWQTGMNISFKAAAPSFKKLDVGQNVKNVFSAKNLFEFVKSLTKIVLLSILVFFMLRGALPTLMTLPYGGMTAVAVATAALLQTLLLQVSLGYAVIAITDL